MTLADIIEFARYRLNNFEKPHFHSDKELVFYCNESLNAFARDTLCLADSLTASVCEIPTVEDTMDYSLAASVIYIRSAKLVTQELLTLDVAPSTAWAAGDTLTGALSTKTCKVVECLTTKTYIIENRTGAFTLGESISNGTNAADQGTTYPTVADHESTELYKATRSVMDTRCQGWRTADQNEPSMYLLDYHTGYITIYPKPDDIYTLRLSVFRYPITAMSATDMSTQTPEIDAKYHNAIIDGICAQAYLKSGENTYDAKKAANHYQLFRKAISDVKIKNVMSGSAESTVSPHGAFI
jgi:hypothetical protein